MEVFEEGLEGVIDTLDDVARERRIHSSLTAIAEKIRALRDRFSQLEIERDDVKASEQAWKKQFALLAEKFEELCGEEAGDIIEKIERFGEHYNKDLLREKRQSLSGQHTTPDKGSADSNADCFDDKYYQDVLVNINRYTKKLKLKKELDDFEDEYRQDNILASIHNNGRFQKTA